MPLAIHEASLIALHTALTGFFSSISYNRQLININVLSNIEASDSLIPDMCISLQNMHTTDSKIIIPGLAETAFSQHCNALVDKLKDVIIEILPYHL